MKQGMGEKAEGVARHRVSKWRREWNVHGVGEGTCMASMHVGGVGVRLMG